MSKASHSSTWITVAAAVLAPACAFAPACALAQAAKPASPPATNVALGSSASPDPVVVDPQTEEVIKGALKYLAAKQTPSGAWTSPNGDHPIAVTAYTIMAFLAAGHLPNEGEYGRNVTNGTNLLMNCMRNDGYLTSESAAAGRKGSNMYDHGIGTVALAEVYGQTQDPKVREKLTLAIKLILSAQSKNGGWRYNPRPADADISVTVLQVVALRAAKNSGLDVPQEVIDRAVAYVKSCHDAKSGGFVYRPNEKEPGFARTSAAIYSLQVCGVYDDPLVKKGADYILRQKWNPSGEWFTYGSYYAAPAFYMIGGEAWQTWYARSRETLVSKVTRQGPDIAYWEAFDSNSRRVGPVYATAVYTTVLAMPYHYLPLYQR